MRPVRSPFVSARSRRPGGPWLPVVEWPRKALSPLVVDDHGMRTSRAAVARHRQRGPGPRAPPPPPDSFLGPPFRGDCQHGGVRSGESASDGMTGLTKGMFHVKHRAIPPRNLVAMFVGRRAGRPAIPVHQTPFGYR